MIEVRLQRARISALVRQDKTGRVAQHMRMHLETDLGRDASAFDQFGQAGDSEWRAPLETKVKANFGLALQCPGARNRAVGKLHRVTICRERSTGQCNTACSLSAGVGSPRSFADVD